MRAQRPLLVGLSIAAMVVIGMSIRLSHSLHNKVRTGGSADDPQPAPFSTPESPGPELFRTRNGNAESDYDALRERMVRDQMAARDIRDPRVLAVMRKVPRHRFVPAGQVQHAYEDRPLPIGHNQTISQPYIVALMTQLVRPTADSRVLDVGTGSGYQAAILAELCHSVASIEILQPLAEVATERLQKLGYQNVTVRCGDGYRGWPEKAPFDAIVVAAAPAKIPPPLLEQLKPGGRLVIPVGKSRQQLLLIEKQPDGSLRRTSVAPVAFVPMTGRAAGVPE
jgi:protein-L-isoaspartate(D-aspartate) O-methyltransferase